MAASVFHSYLNNIIMFIFPGYRFGIRSPQGYRVHGGTATIFIILAVVLVV